MGLFLVAAFVCGRGEKMEERDVSWVEGVRWMNACSGNASDAVPKLNQTVFNKLMFFLIIYYLYERNVVQQ